ncbi:MAG TPA: hypothetical protein VMO26_11870 [Vicinamibacterales bacterium]|nr:hypothetical protein [Vicinamibacterales bacterium]
MTRGRPPLLSIAAGLLCFVGLARLVWVLVGYYALEHAQRHHLETAWMIFIVAAVVAAACLPASRATGALPPNAGGAHPASMAAWIAASLLLYYPSFDIGLLSDDFVLLAQSPVGTDWQFFRPLPLTVWELVHPVAGAAGLHMMNAALHGLNAFLLYRLSARLLVHAPRIQSVAAAVIFLTFPAAVEPVTWIAGIFDVALVTAALLYVNALLTRSQGVSVPALLALTAALLCKETAVVLPAVGWTLRFVTPAHVGTLVWSTAIAATFAAVRTIVSQPPEITAPLGYFVKEMLSRPFATLGTPFTAMELTQAPILFGVIPQLVIATLVALYLFHRRHGLRPLLPASWILLGVAPLLSYFFISETLQGSRYLYLPLVGWSILVAQLSDAGDNRYLRIGGALLVCIMVWYGLAGTVRHQSPWAVASATRDAVLLDAQRAITARGCEAATFADLPDSVEGAYVFRNGFAEAARQAGVRVATSDAAPAGCTFTWREGRFVATPADSDPRTK